MRATGLLYLTDDEVRKALPMTGAIAAMRDAFSQLSRGDVTLPTRLRIDAPADHGSALIMACHSTACKMYSLKIATVYPNNPMLGLPTIQSNLMLIDSATGSPVAIMESAALTAIRTGAASGLATDLLARPEAATVAIFGAGVQARTQIESVCCVRAIRTARVYCRNVETAERFAREMSKQLGIIISRAESPADALSGADIICTATPSRSPVFADRDVPHGAHINAVGSFRPDMIEIPSSTVCRARIFVDHLTSALEEAGDLIGPLQQELVKSSDIVQLGDLILSGSSGRSNSLEITLFKSVGVAIQDLCAAASVVENVRRS